jgi:hypothetical protein
LKDSALTVDSALDIEYTNEFSLKTSVLSNSLHASDVFPDNFDDEEDSGKISAPLYFRRSARFMKMLNSEKIGCRC